MQHTLRADILIHQPNGMLVAAVEIKNQPGLSPETAAAIRRSLIAHGLVAQSGFFLLVSQDSGFLWRPDTAADPDALPDHTLSMAPIVSRYAPAYARERLRNAELELLVYGWLSDLGNYTAAATGEPERTLAEAGFVDAIRGGMLTLDAA